MVSTEELRRDIGTTRDEVKAYNLILDGLYLLAKLPEVKIEAYRYEISKYSVLLSECQNFLRELESMLRKRSLEDKEKK